MIPVADMSDGWNRTASYERFVTYGFSDELNNFAVHSYCSSRNRCSTTDPLVSPLRASDEMLKRLPFVAIDTHGRDPLHDAAGTRQQRFSFLLMVLIILMSRVPK